MGSEAQQADQSYIERIRQMVQSLKAHPKIQIQRVYLSEPAEPYELIDAQQQLSRPMPEGMVQMYRELGDFEIAWSHPPIYIEAIEDNDREPIIGSIRILPVNKLTQDWEDVIWFDFMEDDNIARELIPFDRFTPEACAVLRPEADQFTIDYHYNTEDLWPTGLTFDAWFDRMLMSRGLLFWLEACTVPGQDTYQTHFLKHAGPRLFEHFDFSLFKPQTTEGGIDF